MFVFQRQITDSIVHILKEFKPTKIIGQINDFLHDKCKRNKFHFINNENVTTEILWRDGLNLHNEGTYIFATNLVGFLNGLIFNKDDNTNLGKNDCKQSLGSSDETNQNNRLDCK